MKRKERTVVAPEQCVVEVLTVRPGDIAAPNQPVVAGAAGRRPVGQGVHLGDRSGADPLGPEGAK